MSPSASYTTKWSVFCLKCLITPWKKTSHQWLPYINHVLLSLPPFFDIKKSQGIFPTAKLHSASQPGWLSLLPPERAASFRPRKKNGPTFHSKNWLVNRDPYVMAYEIIPVGFLISQKNLTNQGPFFHCSFKTTCLDAPCIHGNPGNPRKSFIFTGVLRPIDSGPKTVIFQFWGTKAMKYLPTFLEN